MQGIQNLHDSLQIYCIHLIFLSIGPTEIYETFKTTLMHIISFVTEKLNDFEQ